MELLFSCTFCSLRSYAPLTRSPGLLSIALTIVNCKMGICWNVHRLFATLPFKWTSIGNTKIGNALKKIQKREWTFFGSGRITLWIFFFIIVMKSIFCAIAEIQLPIAKLAVVNLLLFLVDIIKNGRLINRF